MRLPALLGATGAGTKVALAASGAVALLVIYRFLLRAERRGNRVAVVTWIVGLLILEGMLWGQNGTPVGPFHPRIGSQNFRLYDLLLPLALLARLHASGRPRRIGPAPLALCAFLAWYATCALVGLVDHNGVNVVYQAKLLVYLGGGYALAAGAAPGELLGEGGLPRLLWPVASAFAALDALYVAHVTLNVTNPRIAIVDLHGVMSDATSVSIVLGVLLLADRLRPDAPPTSVPRWCAIAVLLASAVTSGQRAVLLELAAALGVLVLGWLVGPGRRTRLTPTSAGLGGLTVLAALLASAVARRRSPFSLQSVPLASRITSSTFTNLGKIESAQERANELHQVALLFSGRPLFGWGLGKTIVYYQNGAYTYLASAVADNVYADLLLRTGIVGLALWALAVGSAVWGALRAWLRTAPTRSSTLALAAAASVVGILASGVGESIFEKYRIAVVLGLALGVCRSATLHATGDAAATVRPTAATGWRGLSSPGVR